VGLKYNLTLEYFPVSDFVNDVTDSPDSINQEVKKINELNNVWNFPKIRIEGATKCFALKNIKKRKTKGSQMFYVYSIYWR
jgi:hypothetical protein